MMRRVNWSITTRSQTNVAMFIPGKSNTSARSAREVVRRALFTITNRSIEVPIESIGDLGEAEPRQVRRGTKF